METVWPHLTYLTFLFLILINELKHVCCGYNFSSNGLIFSHNPAKRAALLAV